MSMSTTYLGQIISHKEQTTKELKKRIANCWRRYWSLTDVIKSTVPQHNNKEKSVQHLHPSLPHLWLRNLISLEYCQKVMEKSMISIRKQQRTHKI